MSTGDVSVVIPAHNAEGTVGAAIESAVRQTAGVLEVIVVDDGSSDRTAQVVEQYVRPASEAREESPPIRVITQPQSGPSAARNTAIAAARGLWVAFLDADDTWHSRKLELQLAVAARHPNAVIIATDWLREGPRLVIDTNVKPRCTTFAERDIFVLNRFQTSTVLCRRDAVQSLGGFDSSLDGAEDWDMWLRLARCGEVIKLDCPLVSYRDSADGYSKDLWRVYVTMLAMLDREVARRQFRSGAAGFSHAERSIRRPGNVAMAVILAWHHLRFLVGFVLDGDRAGAGRVFSEMHRRGMLRWAPAGIIRYLVPFLWHRLSSR